MGCHCGSRNRAGNAGSVSVRAQPKAKVSGTTSAASQPVLLGLSGSVSAITRQMPAWVGTVVRQAHRQWLVGRRQAAQRGRWLPPRARNGLVLRASRCAHRRATAWGRLPCGP